MGSTVFARGQRDWRYLVAGPPALSELRREISMAGRFGVLDADDTAECTAYLDAISRDSLHIDLLGQTQQELRRLVAAGSSGAQRDAAGQAHELLDRGLRAAAEGHWREALRDYNQSVKLNWQSPEAHLARGLALLQHHSEAGTARSDTVDATRSFEAAARYGVTTAPELAVRAVQLAVVFHDSLGNSARAEENLHWALEELGHSPELNFAAGLRWHAAKPLRLALEQQPRYACDLPWQLLPFASPVVAQLQRRQAALRQEALNVLADVGRVGTVDTQPPELSCAAGYRDLEGVAAQVHSARDDLEYPSADEVQQRHLLQNWERDVARLEKRVAAYRRLRSPRHYGWTLAQLLLLLLPVCTLLLVELYRGRDFGGAFAQGALPVTVATVLLLVPLTLQTFHAARLAQAIADLRAKEAQLAILLNALAQSVHQREERHARLEPVDRLLHDALVGGPVPFDRRVSIGRPYL